MEAFGGGKCGLETCRGKRGENGASHGAVDLPGADAQAKDAAPIDDALAGAMVARRSSAPGVVGAQPSAAVPAAGEALQKRVSFPHRTPRLMRPRMGVGGDACPIGFIGLPLDESGVVARDEHRPLGARELA